MAHVVDPVDPLLLEDTHDYSPSWQPRAMIFWKIFEMFYPRLQEPVATSAAIQTAYLLEIP
jgi:hypothetical protein